MTQGEICLKSDAVPENSDIVPDRHMAYYEFAILLGISSTGNTCRLTTVLLVKHSMITSDRNCTISLSECFRKT